MENVLEVYHLPYDPDFPVVYMDESNKQLVDHVRPPIFAQPGRPLYIDDEYVRKGVADIFMAVEPLAGKRIVSITETRKREDWAEFIKELLEVHYPEAKKVRLIMDNLNTHNIGSLYGALSPEEALKLAKRLEIHFTPKHGSWLNIAEIELSVLKSQCLDRRIADIDDVRNEVNIWQKDRNNSESKINWQFETSKARIKLRRLYQTL
jgi:hypothetical protein